MVLLIHTGPDSLASIMSLGPQRAVAACTDDAEHLQDAIPARMRYTE